MSYNIGIIGSGQLGSRYLQGLSSLSSPSKIWVYDISIDSLKLSEQRWYECNNLTHTVEFVNDIEELPYHFDCVIVACNADVRYNVTEKIAIRSKVLYWVIEKVLAQSLVDLNKFNILLSNSSGAWVNTPMHIWPLYKKLREHYKGTIPIHAQFLGIQGLACNAIHYIDYVCRWNRTKISRVETNQLQGKWIKSKRKGFYEVLGTIEVFFEDGSYLKMSSSDQQQEYQVVITVLSDVWEIFESKSYGENQNGEKINDGILYQSSMTADLVNEIFTMGRCDLPTISESTHQHFFLIEALTKHWNKNMLDSNIAVLPIT